MLNKDLFALINESANIETRPAKDIFKSSVALCMHNDELCIQFSTIEIRCHGLYRVLNLFLIGAIHHEFNEYDQ